METSCFPTMLKALLPSWKRAACVFTIHQAYLKHHPILLLATLIHRPHNCNAISRSPSAESVCAMHRDLPKQMPGACPAKAAEPLNTVLPGQRKVMQHLQGWLLPSAVPEAALHGCSANCPWQQGTPGHTMLAGLGWAGLGKGNAEPLSGDSDSWNYSGNVPHSGKQGKCLHYSAT